MSLIQDLLDEAVATVDDISRVMDLLHPHDPMIDFLQMLIDNVEAMQ